MTITERAAGLSRVLDLIFSTKQAHARNMIEIYRSIYNLPILEAQFNINEELLAKFSEWEVFVTVAVFDDAGRILVFLEPSEQGQTYLADEPRILGKQVNKVDTFSLEEVANETVKQNCDVSISELIPLAVVKNKFVSGTLSHTHWGVAFASSLDGDFKNPRKLEHAFLEDPPDVMVYQNKSIFLLARDAISRRRFFPDPEEVRAHDRPFYVRALHSFVKRVTYPFGSGRIRQKMKGDVIGAKSIIDVSVGDDHFILDICQEYEPDLVVANDISWMQMQSLMQKASKLKYYMLFSNHNIAHMPFDFKFDVALFKNTLHHIDSKDEMSAILRSLENLAHKLIIVDIEEPSRTLRGRFFNWYYERFYGDAGHSHNFLTQARFRNLISYYFERKDITFETIETIRGRYLMAKITG
ncbi:class I SAM-dependent methyltransferase [Euryhalocaulis caribicus]|uniref:class I SAM-dependent methyltransferase n=1 Tax=Euryhalocaulis caribicus TaxID=1161401 RepID=UPI0003A39FDE|nr:class I SAM-dependent methyltransferase [Euryhalocaulis caribicus]